MSMEPESSASLTAAPPESWRPVDLDVDAFLLAVLLDQVLIAHHVEQQVNDAELFGDADFTFGLGHGRRDQAAGDQAETQADGRGQRCKG